MSRHSVSIPRQRMLSFVLRAGIHLTLRIDIDNLILHGNNDAGFFSRLFGRYPAIYISVWVEGT